MLSNRERELPLNAARLLPGTALEGRTLLLPAAGGGIKLPEIMGGGPRWLNVTLTVQADHAMAFELKCYGEEDAPRVIVRFGMMPGLTACAALDLNWLDGHILFPGHRAGTQKVVCHGSRIRREEIRRTELVSMPCFEPAAVRVDKLTLSDAPGPAFVPEGPPLIDEFGQYTKRDWPGKVKSEETLVADLRRAAGERGGYPFPDWTEWGGCARKQLTEGTGYFSRVRHEGRWYLTDPSGCAFFSMGPDCVTARCDARIDGLEPLLSPLPPREGETAVLYQPLNRAFGETERGPGLMFSYERYNLMRAFGAAWDEAWQGMAVKQLQARGMNTLGNWSDPRLFGRMPYVTSMPAFPATDHLIFRDFPDVLSDEYRQNAAACAEALKERRNDPWMIGYFLRNEPSWAFVDGLIIADEVLRDPAPTACKAGLIAFLKEKYGTPEALSRAWQREFAAFEDLNVPLSDASGLSENARADLREYSAFLTEQYVRIPADACRAVDPNHMILGMRWAWISDPLLVSGWQCFDVFSINCYAVDPTAALENVRTLGVDLPVMIGEFHFGALDAGLPATGLEAVANQAERGKAYRYYCERAAAHPNGVGCHWFQYCDQFALGRFDGENYNIGLFDITLRPYPDMARAVREAAEAVYGVMDGSRKPFDEKPVTLPMIAY